MYLTSWLFSSLEIQSIQVSNILEDDTDQFLIKNDTGAFPLTLKPFQIMTLKVQIA